MLSSNTVLSAAYLQRQKGNSPSSILYSIRGIPVYRVNHLAPFTYLGKLRDEIWSMMLLYFSLTTTFPIVWFFFSLYVPWGKSVFSQGFVFYFLTSKACMMREWNKVSLQSIFMLLGQRCLLHWKHLIAVILFWSLPWHCTIVMGPPALLRSSAIVPSQG